MHSILTSKTMSYRAYADSSISNDSNIPTNFDTQAFEVVYQLQVYTWKWTQEKNIQFNIS